MQAMVTMLVLTLPNFNIPFVVESDASNESIREMFSQWGKHIAYFSKELAPKHQVFLIYEKGMMVILTAVKKIECILHR